MKSRLIVVIALIFAIAGLSGPGMARGIAEGQFWTVGGSANGWSFVQAHEASAADLLKPCAKKLNGQAVPCQQAPAVLPELVTCFLDMAMPVFGLGPDDVGLLRPDEGWYRPPRRADRP